MRAKPSRRASRDTAPPDDPAARLIAEIEAEVRNTRHYLGKDRLDPRVIDALARTPRHEFVPAPRVHLAYDNIPLPIGEEQTISQPYIVAIMTDLLQPRPDDVMLEVGTGSGYQAAVLARLVKRVYTVECFASLAGSAAERLARLGYDNVEVRCGDGALGWPEHAPYDGIIVTAAAPHLPKALLAQLKPGRRLVIPFGRPGEYQELAVVEIGSSGAPVTRAVLPVAFVPLRENS